MNQRKLSRYLLWMALIATLVSAYEFCTRIDAMWKPLKMFWNMAVGEKIPLARAATYVDMSIFEIPLYLLCSVALGIWALWARRTRRGCALLIAPSAVLAALGFILPLTLAGKWVRAVRLLPMIVLCALSVARVVMREPERQRRHAGDILQQFKRFMPSLGLLLSAFDLLEGVFLREAGQHPAFAALRHGQLDLALCDG